MLLKIINHQIGWLIPVDQSDNDLKIIIEHTWQLFCFLFGTPWYSIVEPYPAVTGDGRPWQNRCSPCVSPFALWSCWVSHLPGILRPPNLVQKFGCGQPHQRGQVNKKHPKCWVWYLQQLAGWKILAALYIFLHLCEQPRGIYTSFWPRPIFKAPESWVLRALKLLLLLAKSGTVKLGGQIGILLTL